nr:GPP34 family phosphoprotein [Patulibacter sp. SYSU D01012]
MLGAAVLALVRSGALERRDGRLLPGPAAPADPFDAWVRDALPDGADETGQLEGLAAHAAGRAGRRATEALAAAGLLAPEPRRVLGLPLGRHLRVRDVAALRHDRALVRAVLEGEETHDVAMAALVAYLHHGGLVAHLEPRDLRAAETRAARIAGDARDGAPPPVGPVADAVRATVEAMHVVLVPVGAIQVVTTTAHERR